MRRILTPTIALLLLLLGAAASAQAMQLSADHVALNVDPPGETVKAWGWVKLSANSKLFGVERCRTHAGGELWNADPTLPPPWNHQVGWLGGWAFYHCHQELGPTEEGCHERFNLMQKNPEEWDSELFLEPNGQLRIKMWGGSWTFKCGSVETVMNEDAQVAARWENGTAMGYAPSHMQLTGLLPIFITPNETYVTLEAPRLKIMGEEGLELITLR